MIALVLVAAAASSLGFGVFTDRLAFSIVALLLAAAAGGVLALPWMRGRPITSARSESAQPVVATAGGSETAEPVVTTAGKADKPTRPAKPAAAKAEKPTRPAKPAAAKAEKPASATAAAESAQPAGPVSPIDSEVLHVVRGRRRYHRPGCELLTGLDTDEIVLAEALDEGFSPCTRCCPREHAAVG